MVWMDEDGDVVCCGYTPPAEEFLKIISPNYKNGDILEIISRPDEFKANVPFYLQVGLISPNTNKVVPMEPIPLH